MQSENELIFAAAGTGKTTEIVKRAFSSLGKILITTYTRANTRHIINEISNRRCGVIPSNITVTTWFSFLLSDWVRPYRNYIWNRNRISDLCFVQRRSALYIKKKNTASYYFSDKTETIYSDKLAEFGYECDRKSQGLVIQRLEQLYNEIYVDEVQDMAGYDFEILKLLLESNIKIVTVGDSRQKTYNTAPSRKNKQYSDDVYNWYLDMQKQQLATLKKLCDCYRCNQAICDFADQLFPTLPKTTSRNNIAVKHQGIFSLPLELLDCYIERYEPIILGYDKNAFKQVNNHKVITFGISKGQTFNRVLIVPTNTMIEYLKGKGELAPVAKMKFYVGLTRARHSVAILTNENLQGITQITRESIRI